MSGIHIQFGALAPSLRDQLGAALPSHFQDDADAITRLHVRGVLSDSEAQRARKRLISAIHRDAVSKGLTA